MCDRRLPGSFRGLQEVAGLRGAPLTRELGRDSILNDDARVVLKNARVISGVSAARGWIVYRGEPRWENPTLEMRNGRFTHFRAAAERADSANSAAKIERLTNTFVAFAFPWINFMFSIVPDSYA